MELYIFELSIPNKQRKTKTKITVAPSFSQNIKSTDLLLAIDLLKGAI